MTKIPVKKVTAKKGPAKNGAAKKEAVKKGPAKNGAAKKEAVKKGRAKNGAAKNVAVDPKVPRPSVLPAVGLCVLSAVMNFVAFPGIGIWPLGFIALVPWLFVLDMESEGNRHRTRRVVWLSFLWGTIINAGGFYWIVGTLERFSGFPVALCILFASIVWAFGGGLFAFFSLLYFRARGQGWAPMLVAPFAFAAVEMWYPLLFPNYLAAHLVDLPRFIQIADLGGPILVSMLIVCLNVALYLALRALIHKEAPKRKSLAVAVIAILFTLAYGFFRVAEVDALAAAAPKLTIGMVQVNMGTFDKRSDFLEGRQRHIDDTLALAAEANPDLIIWPESAYASFLPPGTTNVSRYVTGPIETPLIFGGLERRRLGDRVHDYNTAFLVDEDGDVIGTYDKTYLLAFGEFLPFGEDFPILYEWSPNSGRFTPGDHVRPLEFRGYRISALVCYEDIVPAFTRRAVREGDPHLLVNVTNDAWFGDSSEPWQHLALAQLRSVEHHRYLVRSTNSGVSAFIDPVGRVIKQSGVFTRETLSAEVAMMNPWTLYAVVGDWPGWLGTFVILFVCFRRR